MRLIRAAGALAVCMLATLPSLAVEFDVTTELDEVDLDPGDGVCETSSGTCALRAAIQESNALPGADTIRLPEGRFVLTLPDTGENEAADGDLDITSEVDLEGVGRAHSAIEGSSATGRIFHVLSGAALSVSRLRLSDARCCSGCGLMIQGGDASVSDCDVVDIQEIGCAGGGGILIDAGTLALSQVSIRNIRASGMAEGGGILLMGGEVTLDRSDVRFNRALNGGGIAILAGSLEINRSTIALNQANSSGGGIYAESGSLAMSASTLRENAAGSSGGAVHVGAMSASLENCTVTANTADTAGGLRALIGGSITLNNCTVTLNRADTRGHGASAALESVFSLSNSILAANGDPECSGTLWSTGYNLFGEVASGCQILGDATGNQSGLDALLRPLGDPSGYRVAHMPQTGSPAVGAGNPQTPGGGPGACAPTDQVGTPRDTQLPCDMGAVESRPLDGCDLLRSDVIVSLDPLTPPLATIFTGATEGCSDGEPNLHLADPDDCLWGVLGEGQSTPLHGSDDADDLYGFASSVDPNPDPETDLLSDMTRPLIFWQLAPSTWCGPLRITKDPARDSVIIHAGL